MIAKLRSALIRRWKTYVEVQIGKTGKDAAAEPCCAGTGIVVRGGFRKGAGGECLRRDETNCRSGRLRRVDGQPGDQRKTENFSVRPALEQKILQLAMELDYQPNPFLQSMRGGKSKIVGIFDFFHDGSSIMLQSKGEFIDGIQEAGYLPVGRYVHLHRLYEYSVPFPIVGALLFNISSRQFLSFFERKAIPYVVINGICLDNGSAVQIDEKANANLLIGELYRNGHRKIAYYAAHHDAGTPFQHYSGVLRQQGFDEEIARLGLPAPEGDGDAIKQPGRVSAPPCGAQRRHRGDLLRS